MEPCRFEPCPAKERSPVGSESCVTMGATQSRSVDSGKCELRRMSPEILIVVEAHAVEGAEGNTESASE